MFPQGTEPGDRPSVWVTALKWWFLILALRNKEGVTLITTFIFEKKHILAAIISEK
jgi:hypothetical protein